MDTYTLPNLKVLDQAAAVESLPPVPSAVNEKTVRCEQSQRDPEAIDAERTAPVDLASLPPDVARILAAWEQLPLEVKTRLAASIRPPVALRLAR
jgi:hypothetical protein